MATADRIPFSISNRHLGISDDVRIQNFDAFAFSLNFDNFTNPKKSTPLRNTEDNTTDGANTVIQRFKLSGTKLYGLGQVSSASNVTKIYEKSSNNLTDAWTASTNAFDASGARNSGAFQLYEGFLFGYGAGTRIWAYNISGTTFTATALNITAYTNTADGLVTRDDLLLMPYDNKIALKDSGSDATSNWQAAALTLPSDLKIMDLEEWGNYVAVITAPVNPESRHSMLYIWNKVDADPTVAVDLGEGNAQLVGNIDGTLCIVMAVTSTWTLKQKLIVKQYTGGTSCETIAEIDTDSTLTIARGTKIRGQSRMEFAVQATIDSVAYYCMWMVGKKKAGYPVVLTPTNLINNDTIPTSVEGAFKLGQYYFYAINSGTVVRTNNDQTYTATSIYISQRLLAPDHDFVMKWIGITCPSLPAGSTLSLYYRINGTTSWTKIFDLTTTASMGHQAGIDASGADFPKFSEIQFKLTSTGGTALPAEWCSIEGQFALADADMAD